MPSIKISSWKVFSWDCKYLGWMYLQFPSREGCKVLCPEPSYASHLFFFEAAYGPGYTVGEVRGEGGGKREEGNENRKRDGKKMEI